MHWREGEAVLGQQGWEREGWQRNDLQATKAQASRPHKQVTLPPLELQLPDTTCAQRLSLPVQCTVLAMYLYLYLVRMQLPARFKSGPLNKLLGELVVLYYATRQGMENARRFYYREVSHPHTARLADCKAPVVSRSSFMCQRHMQLR
jgi:hypothetical protein